MNPLYQHYINSSELLNQLFNTMDDHHNYYYFESSEQPLSVWLFGFNTNIESNLFLTFTIMAISEENAREKLVTQIVDDYKKNNISSSWMDAVPVKNMLFLINPKYLVPPGDEHEDLSLNWNMVPKALPHHYDGSYVFASEN